MDIIEEPPLSDDEEEDLLLAEIDLLEGLTRNEKIQRRKDLEKKQQRRRWKEREREK